MLVQETDVVSRKSWEMGQPANWGCVVIAWQKRKSPTNACYKDKI